MPTPDSVVPFRLAYVPGVTPGKWVTIWKDRRPDTPIELIPLDVADCADAMRAGSIHMAITRLPDALAHGSPGPHHTIELYTEKTVVVVPKDHLFTAANEVDLNDLAGEHILRPLDESIAIPQLAGATLDHRPETTGDAVELVAAGMGVLVVPQSLARLHHRKDLTYRPVSDAPSGVVGLLWPDPTSDDADEFIGIVRGRKATSSRGNSTPPPKRSAKEKAAAKRARREATTTNRGRGNRR